MERLLSIRTAIRQTFLSHQGRIACLTLLLALALMHTSPVFSIAATTDYLHSPGTQRAAPANGTVDLSIQPANTTVVVDQEFTVDIVGEAGAQLLDAVDAFVDFDPALLQVLEIIPGTTLPIILQSAFDNTLGQIDYSAGRPLQDGPASGTFTLATIRFRALAPTAGTPLAFAFDPPTRNTDVFFEGLSVLGSVTGSTIIIQSPPPAVAPRPVGGFAIPVGPVELLAPWIALAFLAVAAVVGMLWSIARFHPSD